MNTPSPACWVGCDDTLSTDNPMGIQGSFYGFGDGTSCPAMGASPICTPANGVCMSGATIVDSTYKAWGCGIGLELNSTGGAAPMKQLYAGTATCFDYKLSGNSGGNEVRIGFTQSANTANLIAPYVIVAPFTNGATGTVCFKDVSCQTQTKCSASVTTNCCPVITGNGTPYDIQVEVPGGNKAGAFNVCLTSLTPKGTGSSTFGQLCGAQGSSTGIEVVDKYLAQNNVNANGGSLCVTPGFAGGNATLNIDTANLNNNTGNVPAAYPSLVDGWHYGKKSNDTALPKAVSSLGTVMSNAMYTGSSGKYDAAYDIWVLPSNANPTDPSGGLEVMIWLNSSGVVPAGTSQGASNAAGTTGYTVYKANSGVVGNWTYVAYQKSGATSFNGDLAPFIKDAVSRAGMNAANVYLQGIEFGFELWTGGQGMKVTQFNATVN